MPVSTTQRHSIADGRQAEMAPEPVNPRLPVRGRSTVSEPAKVAATRSWGRSFKIAAIVSAAGLVLLLLGTRLPLPGLSPWPRFWASAYFVVLLWPIGVTLVGVFAGRGAQVACAALLLTATIGQQVVIGSIAPSPADQWLITLVQPGDAIRQRILLPQRSDVQWDRAWQKAASATIAICTRTPVPPSAGVLVSLNDRSPVPLTSLARSGADHEQGWYSLPVLRQDVEQSGREVTVLVERHGAEGGPATFCGGRDDPARPGSGGAERRRNGWDGQWAGENLADIPLPMVANAPMLGRHYIELRLNDALGMPVVGIYY